MAEHDSFEQTRLNQVRRVPKNSHYDRETINRVFDQAWICHVGFAGEDYPTVIPMFHVRVGNEIIFHGASTSRLMQKLASGDRVCLSAAIVDGLVLARSLFHHSMNYRSAIAFGTGRLIDERTEVMSAFKALADKVMPGRWEDARQPNEKEIKATSLVAVTLESASAKVRTGGPVDEDEDKDLPVWAGVVPFPHTVGNLERASNLAATIAAPDYLQEFCQNY